MEEQFPVPRNTAASKIGNGVISLLWQLRCHRNPDQNKFSSLSNTTVVSIFPNLCLWRRSLRSNLGGIDLEKLYRATINYTFFAVNCLFISHDFRRHIIAERSIRNIIKSACSRYSQNAIKRNMVDLFLCLVRTYILSSLFSSFLMTAIAVFFVCFFLSAIADLSSILICGSPIGFQIPNDVCSLWRLCKSDESFLKKDSLDLKSEESESRLTD